MAWTREVQGTFRDGERDYGDGGRLGVYGAIVLLDVFPKAFEALTTPRINVGYLFVRNPPGLYLLLREELTPRIRVGGCNSAPVAVRLKPSI